MKLTILPLAVTSLLCFVYVPIFHKSFTRPLLLAWLVILFMGRGDLALTFLVMNRA